MLHPKRAVLVEGGDAFRLRHKIRAARVRGRLDEFLDGCFAAPSFHDGNGSWARTIVDVKATTPTSAAASRFCMYVVFIIIF